MAIQRQCPKCGFYVTDNSLMACPQCGSNLVSLPSISPWIVAVIQVAASTTFMLVFGFPRIMIAIFVGLLFWSWIWGVWGAVLAVPMLMMVKAVCDHIEELQSVGELLGE